MASEAKKRKAKNSYLYNGGTRLDGRLKRILYFRKRDRVITTERLSRRFEQ